MKFIIRNGSPDIPIELLEFQQQDELVIFCGAGVSMNANLPSFKGLVEQIYSSLNISLDDNQLEADAFSSGNYDRVLEHVEYRFQQQERRHKFLVRENVIKLLEVQNSANLSTHNALLHLARTSSGKIRLVTTNFDECFIKSSHEIMVDSAPKLPIPKPRTWNSLVHLHGLIDKEIYPDGENLILTSGDFGRAYLTERWASTFVTNLFRHFTILFIGYSLNDPVMRYITDAIAAERRLGYEGYRKPYIIAASSSEADYQLEKEKWEALGLQAILYTVDDVIGHSNLHDSLIEWANYYKDGLNEWERIIKTRCIIDPIPPYDNEQNKQIIDILNFDARLNPPQRGQLTKIFSRLEPAPPINWLHVFRNEHILLAAAPNTECHPVSNNFQQEPDPCTLTLWNWIARHLDKQEVVDWVIDNGTELHPKFRNIVRMKIQHEPVPEPFLTFWKLVISPVFNCYHKARFYEIYREVEKFTEESRLSDRLDLLNLFKPALVFKNAIKRENIEVPLSLADIADIDVELLIDRSNYNLIKEKITVTNYFPSVIYEMTTYLKNVMQFWELTFLTPVSTYDYSHIHMPSIEAHHQNNEHESWTILVEILRDSWSEINQKNAKLAHEIMSFWKTIKFPVFRRLVLHCYTFIPDKSSEALFYLLEDSNYWLWASVTRREVFRLLNVICLKLNGPAIKELIVAILSGPLRELFSEDIIEDRWKQIFDQNIWLFLAKLKQFNMTLPVDAQQKLDELSKHHPEWKLKEDDRDEFSYWLTIGRGYEVDMTGDVFSALPVETKISILKEKNSYHQGRVNLLRESGKANASKIVDVLKELYESQDWDEQIWHMGLLGLFDSSENHFLAITKMLKNAPDPFYEAESKIISMWLKKSSYDISPDSVEEDCYWQIFQKILNNFQVDMNNNRNIKAEDIIDVAINNPFGFLTESLMRRLDLRKLKQDSSIPHGEISEISARLIEGESFNYLIARVILISRLHYFIAIDESWSKEKLIPLLKPENPESIYLWTGLAWAPVASLAYCNLIKDELIHILKRADSLGATKVNLFYIFALICIEHPNLYTPEQKTKVLRELTEQGREKVLWYLYQSFPEEQEKAFIYWKDRVKPFIISHWPKDTLTISEDLSVNLTRIMIQTQNEFPDSLKVLKGLLSTISNPYFVITDLAKSDIPIKFPKDLFDLLSLLYRKEWKIGLLCDELESVLNQCIQINPDLSNHEIYKKLIQLIKEQRIR